MIERPSRVAVPAVLLMLTSLVLAQESRSFRVTRISPSDKGVPGEILEIQIEGLGDTPIDAQLHSEDFRVDVIQDGVKQEARVRVVSFMMIREQKPDGTMSEMKPFHNVSFVVPGGLHTGNAQVVLSYKGEQAGPLNLTIVDRPPRPSIAGPVIITSSPTSLPPPPPGTRMTDMGWRFERDSKVQLHIRPLVDPDDPRSAVLVRFKQGEAAYDAPARVVHQEQKVEQRGRGVAFLPARDFLEVEVPAALSMGPAEMEIKLRANGAESDPATLHVQITDTTRSAEAPVINAPRLLAVTPRKVGAGQALMLSVDYLRTLNPDPAQTLVAIEHETARYILRPETNSALRMPEKAPDAPVAIIVRTTRDIIGAAQVRIINSLKGEQGGTSPAISIEIVDEVLPPEITSAAESNDADLSRLRQMYALQRAAGRPFTAYDPNGRYLTIRGRGIDPNPRFVQITLEQSGATIQLKPADVSMVSPELYIVKLPRSLSSGSVRISVVNLSAQGSSVPATVIFELSR